MDGLKNNSKTKRKKIKRKIENRHKGLTIMKKARSKV